MTDGSPETGAAALAEAAGSDTTMNDRRAGAYRKDDSDERFLEDVNDLLGGREVAGYPDGRPEHPLVFVFGIPRSATTLTSQVVAHGLDIGYIDNVAARFWRAPVHGIRLSRILLGRDRSSDFSSDYARTGQLTDIHEFGYFWREHLHKATLEDIVRSPELEGSVDWALLRRTLAAMQRELGSGIAAKNINGAYHLPRLSSEIGNTIWVYIRRNPLDAAISIHDARVRYYGDPSVWWSYTPLEYERLKDEPWDRQIAGQVHFLTRMYERFARDNENVIAVDYEELCTRPRELVERIAGRFAELHGGTLTATPDSIPESFPMRSYDGTRSELAARLQGCLDEWKEDTP